MRDVAGGIVKIKLENDGKGKSEDHYLQIPEDTANGLVLILLKNISPSDAETEVSMVATTSKPGVVNPKFTLKASSNSLPGGSERNSRRHRRHSGIGRPRNRQGAARHSDLDGRRESFNVRQIRGAIRRRANLDYRPGRREVGKVFERTSDPGRSFLRCATGHFAEDGSSMR
jgi:hypothetical protein